MKRLLLFGFALAATVAWAAAGLRGEGTEPPDGGLRLELDARVVWREPGEDFGGYSGLAILDGGARALFISDRGTWALAEMRRDTGRLTGLSRTGSGPLLGIEGEPLTGLDQDAEGLALDAEGRVYISFEGFHRVRRYDSIDGPASGLPKDRRFRKLQNNSGLEALTTDGAGVLYAIPERSGKPRRPFPVFRLRDGRWDVTFRIPRVGRFLVTGADFGPDGALYLLERDFSWLGGFATRIRRFEVTPEGLDAGMTLLETGIGLDNMEGISVWRDAGGVTRVTLIADDNFFPLQTTLMAEYRLVGP